MSAWAIVAVVYGVVLTVAALTLPIRRRVLVTTACLAYALLAIGAGTVRTALLFNLVAPGVFLLTGYWLSGCFFRDPQRWLEVRLLRWDRAIFRAIGLDRWLRTAPQWALEALEACYAAVYVVIGGGAIVAALAGSEAVSHFWLLVLTAELACYVWLPWLRSRPPRALEAPGAMAVRAPRLRRLNGAIVDRASVQANTLPSGHVAGATAAALGLLPVSAVLGAVLLVVALVIAAAATAGRYHYAVDCAAGALVAVFVWSVV